MIKKKKFMIALFLIVTYVLFIINVNYVKIHIICIKISVLRSVLIILN